MAQGRADAWGTTTIEGRMIGRDNVIVPPEQVEDLAELGCSSKEIANFFGVSESALSRNFATELQKGREVLKQKLRRAMLENAIVHKNAAVQIFLAKNMLGMSDTGMTSEEFKPLPWTDTLDDDTPADEDDIIGIEPATTDNSTEQ